MERHRQPLRCPADSRRRPAVLAGDLQFAGISLQDTLSNLNSRITALEAIIEALVGEITPAENE